MSLAAQVLKAITEHYTYDGWTGWNACDLAKHLKSDRLDHGTPAPFKNEGFTVSYDDSLHVFCYSDRSALVIGDTAFATGEQA